MIQSNSGGFKYLSIMVFTSVGTTANMPNKTFAMDQTNPSHITNQGSAVNILLNMVQAYVDSLSRTFPVDVGLNLVSAH